MIEDPLAAAKAALAEAPRQGRRHRHRRLYESADSQQAGDAERRSGSDHRRRRPGDRLRSEAGQQHAGRLRGQGDQASGRTAVYTDAEGRGRTFLTARYVELDEIIPDDPQMAEITAGARKEIDVVQTRLAEEEAAAIAGKPLNTPFSLPGILRAVPHRSKYKSGKIRAIITRPRALEEKQRMFDVNCIGCHSLSYRDQGFVSVKATPQSANVHCESCHGPGGEHIKARPPEITKRRRKTRAAWSAMTVTTVPISTSREVLAGHRS